MPKTIKSTRATAKLLPYKLEISKKGKGTVMAVSGTISVEEVTPQLVRLVTHSGRIAVRGERIYVNLLEDRISEIIGSVEEIRFE